MLRNRVSAQQARERKKAYLIDLEARVKELETKNAELEERLSTLQNENQMLRHVCPNLTPCLSFIIFSYRMFLGSLSVFILYLITLNSSCLSSWESSTFLCVEDLQIQFTFIPYFIMLFYIYIKFAYKQSSKCWVLPLNSLFMHNASLFNLYDFFRFGIYCLNCCIFTLKGNFIRCGETVSCDITLTCYPIWYFCSSK